MGYSSAHPRSPEYSPLTGSWEHFALELTAGKQTFLVRPGSKVPAYSENTVVVFLYKWEIQVSIFCFCNLVRVIIICTDFKGLTVLRDMTPSRNVNHPQIL